MKKVRFLSVLIIVLAIVMEMSSLGIIYAAEEAEPEIAAQESVMTESIAISDNVLLEEASEEEPGEVFPDESLEEEPEEESEEDQEEELPGEPEEEPAERSGESPEVVTGEEPEKELEEESGEEAEEVLTDEGLEEKLEEELPAEPEEKSEEGPKEEPKEESEEGPEEETEEMIPEEESEEKPEEELQAESREEPEEEYSAEPGEEPEEELPEGTDTEEISSEEEPEDPSEAPAAPALSETEEILIGFSISEEIQEEEVWQDESIQENTQIIELGVVKSGENGTAFQMNTIPVIQINIDESNGNTIANMNDSTDHSAYCYGTIDIIVPEGYVSEYTNAEVISLTGLDLEYIRGRGNSTWSLDKKPYKFKLDKSTDLFGMGKNKHWVLLANRMDDTLVKNRITFWLSDTIGLDYTPQCVPVDVVMNGSYIGSYLLVEQVRVGKSRVDIEELKESMTEEPDITGGYLLAIGTQDINDTENYWVTDKGVQLITDTPEFAEGEYENDIQRQYIRNYIQAMENAIFGENYSDSEGNGYGEYLDIDSAIDYWWIQTLTQNPDGFDTGSTYMYKDREDKLYFGPVWDFDAAWNWAGMSSEGFDVVKLLPWYECMFTDASFAEKVVSRWYTIRDYIEELVREGGILDQYYEETKASQQYDETLWGLYKSATIGDFVEDEGQTDVVSYKDRIETLRTWIIDRRDWIDENVDSILNLVHVVSFMDGNTDLETMYVKNGMLINQFPEVPEKEGYYFLGWYSEDGVRIDSNTQISENLVIRPVYLENSQVTRAQEIYFAESHIYVPSMLYNRSIAYTVLPEDAMDKTIVWTSSDESIITVDADGTIYMKDGTGTVTVTGTLSSGNSYSYTVTVYDWDEVGDDVPVEGVTVDPTALHLQVGEYQHIGAQIEPPYASDYEIEFVSENPSIAVVYPGGIVKGICEGTTRIIVRDKWSDKYIVCLVTVGGEEEEPITPEPEEEEPITPEPTDGDLVPPEPQGDDPVQPETDDDGLVPIDDDSVPLGPDKKDPNNRADEGNGNSGKKIDNSPGVIPGPDSNGQYRVPATGDEQSAAVWMALMGMSVLMIVFCVLFFVRKAKKR